MNAEHKSLQDLFPNQSKEFLVSVRKAFQRICKEVGPWDAPDPRVIAIEDKPGEILWYVGNRAWLAANPELLDRTLLSRQVVDLSK